jgi:carbon monoxide dehydrogenase subunit G
MLIENSFPVAADPDRVFAFLSVADNVVTCMPGAELVEDLGNDAYRGKVKIKIGPVTAAYSGIATITERDTAGRVVVLVAEGKDAKGNGAAKATATMRVTAAADGAGSTVQLSTDLSVTGKLAQFGRSVMADVSNKMVGQLATRVRETIEAANTPEPVAAAAATVRADGSDVDSSTAGISTAGISTGDSGAASAEPPAAGAAPVTTPTPARPAADDAIKASSIVWSVLGGVFRRLFARLRGRGTRESA